MPSAYVSADLRKEVINRARDCCEYCLLGAEETEFSHEIDHIVPIIHDGKAESDNLAFACLKCNRHKGTNLVAFDRLDGSLVALFNPRIHNWDEHFALAGAHIIGLTPSGRATVDLLKMNDDIRVERRRRLIEAGRYPPSFK